MNLIKLRRWDLQPKQADWIILRDGCQLEVRRSPVHPRPEQLIHKNTISSKFSPPFQAYLVGFL